MTYCLASTSVAMGLSLFLPQERRRLLRALSQRPPPLLLILFMWGNGLNTVLRVLFRRRELTEFRGKLGELFEKLAPLLWLRWWVYLSSSSNVLWCPPPCCSAFSFCLCFVAWGAVCVHTDLWSVLKWGYKYGELRKGPPFHGLRSYREMGVQNVSYRIGGREVTWWWR